MIESHQSTLLEVHSRRAWGACLRSIVLTFVCVCSTPSGSAQQAKQTASPEPPLSPNLAQPIATNEDEQYRIGAGDQLSIQVFGKPQLSRDQWVDAHGLIKMPLLEEDIRAACRTESELAQEIARMYRDHELLRNPAVYVSVKEYQSQPVAVLGSVNTPGRFILHRQIRLRELLVFYAGGPSAKAGRRVQILSTSTPSSCASATGGAVAETRPTQAENGVADYDLQDLLSEKEAANPLIHRGDIINVPAAAEVFIVGNVLKPSSVPVDEATSMGRALAMVGGMLPQTDREKIRVLRQVPGTKTTTEILVDLSKPEKKGADFLLLGGDIVEVNGKTGFSKVLGDLYKMAIPMATTLPYRVIP